MDRENKVQPPRNVPMRDSRHFLRKRARREDDDRPGVEGLEFSLVGGGGGDDEEVDIAYYCCGFVVRVEQEAPCL